MDNSPNSSTYSSSSPNSIDIANWVLAPVGVTLLLLLVSVIAYVFARRRQSVGVLFDETATAGYEDEIDEDEYFGVSEETMRSFPKFEYLHLPEFVLRESSSAAEETSGSCTICLYEYKDADVIRMLPACNHFFHQGCVDQWLKFRSTCPICRISLIRSTCFSRLN